MFVEVLGLVLETSCCLEGENVLSLVGGIHFVAAVVGGIVVLGADREIFWCNFRATFVLVRRFSSSCTGNSPVGVFSIDDTIFGNISKGEMT